MKDEHSFFIKDMQTLGYIPEGLLNWCVLMGWGVAEDDVMTLAQMVERFSIDSLRSKTRQMSRAGESAAGDESRKSPSPPTAPRKAPKAPRRDMTSTRLRIRISFFSSPPWIGSQGGEC